MINTCAVCGNEFETEHATTKLCSNDCYKARRRQYEENSILRRNGVSDHRDPTKQEMLLAYLRASPKGATLEELQEVAGARTKGATSVAITVLRKKGYKINTVTTTTYTLVEDDA
jgi:hypothetical protein